VPEPVRALSAHEIRAAALYEAQDAVRGVPPYDDLSVKDALAAAVYEIGQLHEGAPDPRRANDVTAEELVPLLRASHGGDQHTWASTCPTCGQSCGPSPMVATVYTFVICRCPAASHPHLRERLWHAACFDPARQATLADG